MHSHTPAKKEREKGVEFGFDEEAAGVDDGDVEPFCPVGGVGGTAAVGGHVGDKNAEEGEAAQNVYRFDTFAGLGGGDGCGLLFGHIERACLLV